MVASESLSAFWPTTPPAAQIACSNLPWLNNRLYQWPSTIIHQRYTHSRRYTHTSRDSGGEVGFHRPLKSSSVFVTDQTGATEDTTISIIHGLNEPIPNHEPPSIPAESHLDRHAVMLLRTLQVILQSLPTSPKSETWILMVDYEPQTQLSGRSHSSTVSTRMQVRLHISKLDAARV